MGLEIRATYDCLPYNMLLQRMPNELPRMPYAFRNACSIIMGSEHYQNGSLGHSAYTERVGERRVLEIMNGGRHEHSKDLTERDRATEMPTNITCSATRIRGRSNVSGTTAIAAKIGRFWHPKILTNNNNWSYNFIQFYCIQLYSKMLLINSFPTFAFPHIP